jgi:glucose dehydrogenase
MLTAVDVAKGTIRWQIPLSRFDAPLPPGAINLGGPFVTAGRLVLIASTIDPFIRTFASSPIQAA